MVSSGERDRYPVETSSLRSAVPSGVREGKPVQAETGEEGLDQALDFNLSRRARGGQMEVTIPGD